MTYNDYIDLKEFENKIVDSWLNLMKMTKMMKLKKYKKEITKNKYLILKRKINNVQLLQMIL